ncbi:MAG: isochorismatase family protein [Deferrisomatales bacterium]
MAVTLPHPDECFAVAVDVQPRLLGAYPPARARRLVDGVSFALEALGVLGVPALLLELEPDKLGPVHPHVQEAAGGAAPISKVWYDATREPAFLGAVEDLGRRTALVLGIEAHVCVLHTAAGLVDRGLQVHYLVDAVASRDAEDEAVGRRLMEAAGVRPLSTETLLFGALESSRHPRFREVLGVIKEYLAAGPRRR